MSPIIEVLIGMVFLYSLLSILVTQINAVIASSLRLRAQYLRDALNDLIQDNELYAKVITHPLIRLSAADMVLPNQKLDPAQIDAIIKGAVNNIGWIASDTFVNVLINLIRVDSDNELFGALLNVVDGMPAGEERRRLRLIINQIMNSGQGLEELERLIAELKDTAYREALVQALDAIADEIADMGLETESNIALMAGLRNIKNPYFRNALETILSTSKTIDEAEENLAKWFNDGMDRASGTFKQAMTYWSLGIGLLIAVVLNVDSLFIAEQLWNNQALRETVVASAQATDIAVLEAANAAAEATVASEEDGSVEETSAAIAAASETFDTLTKQRLPMGWSLENLKDVQDGDLRLENGRYLWNLAPWNNSNWLMLWVIKILGISATSVAIAQGAPFWFGILKRLSGGTT